MARQPVPQRKYPKAHVGGYRAVVDTSGMDEAMKEIMGVARPDTAVVKKKQGSWDSFLGWLRGKR